MNKWQDLTDTEVTRSKLILTVAWRAYYGDITDLHDGCIQKHWTCFRNIVGTPFLSKPSRASATAQVSLPVELFYGLALANSWSTPQTSRAFVKE